MAAYKPGSGPSPGTASAHNLILDFLVCGNVRNNFLLFVSYQSMVCFYKSLNGLTNTHNNTEIRCQEMVTVD